MVEYLPKWHRIDDLLHLVQFVGIRRPNYPTESTYPIIWVDVPQMAISSTLIRQKSKVVAQHAIFFRECDKLYSREGTVSR